MRTLPLFLLFVACAKAPPPAAAVPALDAPLPEVERELLLWRVSKAGAVSHLMGTCHLPIPLDDMLPDPAPLAEARVLIVEVALDGLDPVEVMKAIWDESRSNYDALGRERFAEISRRLHPEMPASMIDHMRPWVVAAGLALADLDLSTPDGTPATVSVDRAVASFAAAEGVPLIPVETLAEQAALMETLGVDLAAVPTPEEEAAASALIEGTMRMCLRGDLAVESQFSSEVEPDYAKLLDERNLAWFPKLLPELTTGGAFVAVGAGHMVGPTGLLQQARDAGFDVERLKGTVTEYPLPSDVASSPPMTGLLGEDAMEPMLDNVVPSLCAEGGLVRTCFEADDTTCTERASRGLSLCIYQVAPDPETLATFSDPTKAQQLMGCVVASLVARSLATGEIGDDPICQQMVPPSAAP